MIGLVQAGAHDARRRDGRLWRGRGRSVSSDGRDQLAGAVSGLGRNNELGVSMHAINDLSSLLRADGFQLLSIAICHALGAGT